MTTEQMLILVLILLSILGYAIMFYYNEVNKK
jgi:hypothetical protein